MRLPSYMDILRKVPRLIVPIGFAQAACQLEYVSVEFWFKVEAKNIRVRRSAKIHYDSTELFQTQHTSSHSPAIGCEFNVNTDRKLIACHHIDV